MSTEEGDKLHVVTADDISNNKKRLGKSKISGTLKGSVLAGQKILYLIFKYYFKKKVGLLW